MLSGKVTNVIRAEYQSDHQLKLQFDNGYECIVDFGPFLRAAKHPDIREYLDPELFKQFEIKHGNLDWNDRDLCFPIADLYEGTVVKTPLT